MKNPHFHKGVQFSRQVMYRTAFLPNLDPLSYTFEEIRSGWLGPVQHLQSSKNTVHAYKATSPLSLIQNVIYCIMSLSKTKIKIIAYIKGRQIILSVVFASSLFPNNTRNVIYLCTFLLSQLPQVKSTSTPLTVLSEQKMNHL